MFFDSVFQSYFFKIYTCFFIATETYHSTSLPRTHRSTCSTATRCAFFDTDFKAKEILRGAAAPLCGASATARRTVG